MAYTSRRFQAPLLCLVAMAVSGALAVGGARPATPREPRPGEIPVSEPGNCAKPGATYVLTRDITSPTSGFFLGNDVTLDLNGHTLTYAAGYTGVPNCGFEDGLKVAVLVAAKSFSVAQCCRDVIGEKYGQNQRGAPANPDHELTGGIGPLSGRRRACNYQPYCKTGA